MNITVYAQFVKSNQDCTMNSLYMRFMITKWSQEIYDMLKVSKAFLWICLSFLSKVTFCTLRDIHKMVSMETNWLCVSNNLTYAAPIGEHTNFPKENDIQAMIVTYTFVRQTAITRDERCFQDVIWLWMAFHINYHAFSCDMKGMVWRCLTWITNTATIHKQLLLLIVINLYS